MTQRAELDWTAQGPRSLRFDDVYFSAEDGLAESRLVFLQGCGLPQAWAGRERFVVGELGFGAGLNALALTALWRDERPSPGARLHLFSVDAWPMTAEEAGRALTSWPELADLAGPLLARWPDGRRGFQRIDLPWGVTLDLAVMDAHAALAAWSGSADAWFLDGFAPARNPGMWSPELLTLVARRSAPGARAATYTVARTVRDGLAAAGFSVDKRPGFGRKRERLEARLPGELATGAARPATVAIVGGGVAGAALARAFAAEGVAPVLVEAEGLGAGASGNPAALVTPWLDAGLGPAARLHALAFARAVQLYREAEGAVIAAGALQLERRPPDGARFDAVAGWEGFAPDALQRLDAEAVALALHEPDAASGLWIRDGLTIEPARVIANWTAGAAVTHGAVAGLERSGEGWRLRNADGGMLAETDVVCLAAGLCSAVLAGLSPLRPVRGQVSWAEVATPVPAAAWGGYAIPTRTGVLFGATHGRGDVDTAPRDEDDAANLRSLAEGRPALTARLAGAPLSRRAATRAATPDHLPLAGAVPGARGLFILAGLGGRGFTLAPLMAEHIVAEAVGAPSPLPRDLAALVRPERFG